MFRDNSAMRKHLHTHGPRVHVCAECGEFYKTRIFAKFSNFCHLQAKRLWKVRSLSGISWCTQEKSLSSARLRDVENDSHLILIFGKWYKKLVRILLINYCFLQHSRQNSYRRSTLCLSLRWLQQEIRPIYKP